MSIVSRVDQVLSKGTYMYANLDIALLLSFRQFLLLVCRICGMQRRGTAIHSITKNGVERNRSVRLQTICADGASLSYRTRPLTHSGCRAKPMRRRTVRDFASTANTYRCALSVPDAPNPV